MFVVTCGNVIDGFDLIGPFKSADEAIFWAESSFLEEWVIAKLQDPNNPPL
jgi:hypothetical protein